MLGIPYRYIKYWLYALNKHSLHAPHIYELYTEVINSDKEYYCFQHLKNIREQLLNDKHLINIRDYGAGSLKTNKKQRKVEDIAKSGLSSGRFSELLFKLISAYRPDSIIELGTSLGLNSLYLSSFSAKLPVFTFEGCPETASYARNLFKKEKKKNIEIIEGNIDETLPAFIDQQTKVDFIYFDANHSFEPTLRYFHTCLKKAHHQTLFIFDDIHWSSEMERAWKEIIKHPKVTVSIDIFDAGIVLFNHNLSKSNYILDF